MASVRAAIHVNPRIPWHVRFASAAAMGLRSVGVPFAVTQSHERLGHAIPILLGTTFWRGIESNGPFLLVDRCSFGSPGRDMHTAVRSRFASASRSAEAVIHRAFCCPWSQTSRMIAAWVRPLPTPAPSASRKPGRQLGPNLLQPDRQGAGQISVHRTGQMKV